MSRLGNRDENVVAQFFFSKLKKECVIPKIYATSGEARTDFFIWKCSTAANSGIAILIK